MCKKTVNKYLICGHDHLGPTLPCMPYYRNLEKHKLKCEKYHQRGTLARLLNRKPPRPFNCPIYYKNEIDTTRMCPSCYSVGKRPETGIPPPSGMDGTVEHEISDESTIFSDSVGDLLPRLDDSLEQGEQGGESVAEQTGAASSSKSDQCSKDIWMEHADEVARQTVVRKARWRAEREAIQATRVEQDQSFIE